MYLLTRRLEFMWIFSYILGYLMGKFNILNYLNKVNILFISNTSIFFCIIKVIIENLNLTFNIGKFILLYDCFFHIF